MRQSLEKIDVWITDDCDNSLTEVVYKNCPIYSCLIYKAPNKTGYKLVCSISDIERYNTLQQEQIVQCVRAAMQSTIEILKQTIVAYAQPPLQILLEAAEPLIQSQAKLQNLRWHEVEFDDLCQMCRLTIVKLYRKGYYIHPWLIKKSFERDVLMYIRHEKNKPQFIYLDETVVDNDNGFSDIIPDQQELDRIQDEEAEEELNELRSWQKQVLINEIGQRQYDQLLLEYGSKNSTNWSRNLVHRLKQKFNRGDL